MGPGAGKHGGTVVAEGLPEEIIQSPASLTEIPFGALEIKLQNQRPISEDRKLR